MSSALPKREPRKLFRWLVALLAVTLPAAFLVGAVAAPASAHGSVDTPASRLYSCFFLHPASWGQPSDNPMCQKLWDEPNSYPMYDWMSDNDFAADSNSEATIPDGKLCSGGNPAFAVVDTPSSQWPTTEFRPDADGKYTVSWTNNAPHPAKYYRTYLTKQGFDPSKALKWSDLELVNETGPMAAAPTTHYRMALPARTGQHVMYTIWQRSDSKEAFFSCSDVTLGASGTPTPSPSSSGTATPSPTTATPSPSGTTTAMPSGSPTMPGMGAAVMAHVEEDSSWATGWCGKIAVHNASEHRVRPLTIAFEMPVGSTLRSTWNGTSTTNGNVVTLTAPDWAAADPGQYYRDSGFCMDGSASGPFGPMLTWRDLVTGQD
ncbi:MAG: lytic polysaccharide monooxygenase, partial [Candidatus Nanopelagicales bacterium]